MASSLLNVSRLVPVIAHAAVYSAISEKPRTALAFNPTAALWRSCAQQLLNTEEGLALVEQTLTHIEHNIPS